MRRRFAYAVASLGLMLVVAAPALAAPSNGSNTEVIPVNCDGADLHVLTGRGLPAWGSDASGNLDGTMYLVKELTISVYAGDLATQPTTDPLFVETFSPGNKTGLGETIRCTFREVETDSNGTVTIFGDVLVVQIR